MRLRLLIALAVLLIGGTAAWFFTTKKSPASAPRISITPTVVGTVTVGRFPQSVAADGDYLYVADGSSVIIVDVRDPRAARQVGSYTFDGVGTLWDITVQGQRVYARSDRIVVLDISDPTNPQTPSAGIVVLDISDPTNPQPLSAEDDAAHIITFGITLPSQYYELTDPTIHRKMAVRGDHGYILEYNDGLVTVNLENPEAPIAVGTADFGHFDVSEAEFVVRDGMAAVTELRRGLTLVDVADASRPTVLGTFPSDEASDVAVTGQVALIAHMTQGLQAVDISDPASPELIATVPTGRGASAVAASGRYAYVVEFNGGGRIHIIELASADLPPMAPRTGGDCQQTWSGFAYSSIQSVCLPVTVHECDEPELLYPTTESCEAENGVVDETLEITDLTDADGDKLFDFEEGLYGTSIENRDSDSDGYDDTSEIINRFDPTGPGPFTATLFNGYCTRYFSTAMTSSLGIGYIPNMKTRLCDLLTDAYDAIPIPEPDEPIIGAIGIDACDALEKADDLEARLLTNQCTYAGREIRASFFYPFSSHELLSNPQQ